MAVSPKARSSGPVLPLSSKLFRSISPSTPAFAYSSTTFSPQSSSSSSFFKRSDSPKRFHLYGSTSTVRFSIDSPPISPKRSIAVDRVVKKPAPPPPQRRKCLCSPTTHPGSFRCSLHKNFNGRTASSSSNSNSSVHAVSLPSNGLSTLRSAMTNSLVRIGSVEGGDWVKRALSLSIGPSSHQQTRRAAFQPRPSRLSVMSKASD